MSRTEPPAELTKQQLQNLMTYGRCEVCKWPRELKRETRRQGKQTVYSMGIVCPNGHLQP